MVCSDAGVSQKCGDRLMNNDSVVIVSAKRTPMGGFMGGLSTLNACELGASAITAALEEAGQDKPVIDEVIMGCVLPAGLGQAPARQASIKAGLPLASGAITPPQITSVE